MLAPEDDFSTWSSILVATAEPDGEYHLFLPGFERLRGAYCENGALPEAIAGSTDEFGHSVMHAIFTAFLQLARPSAAEAGPIHAFLQRAAQKLTTGFLAGRKSCGTELLAIFDSRSDLYAGLGSSAPVSFKDLVRNYITQGSLDAVIDKFSEAPSLDLFELINQLLLKFSHHFPPNENVAFLEKLTGPLSHLLSGYTSANLRQVDTRALTAAADFIVDSPLHELDPGFLEFLWRFGDLCLRSGFLEKELIGAKLLSSLAREFKESFRKLAGET
jgi:hypothetical protein